MWKASTVVAFALAAGCGGAARQPYAHVKMDMPVDLELRADNTAQTWALQSLLGADLFSVGVYADGWGSATPQDAATTAVEFTLHRTTTHALGSSDTSDGFAVRDAASGFSCKNFVGTTRWLRDIPDWAVEVTGTCTSEGVPFHLVADGYQQFN